MSGISYGYEVDDDARYHFKFFDKELVRALGRLTLNASYMEGCIRTLFARLLDNDDLDLGGRVTADSGFRWLVDHTRALSEHRLPEDLHRRILDWLRECEIAYARRNRIVHSETQTHFSEDWSKAELHWTRSTAKRRSFVTETFPATADEVHEIARDLERLGISGVDLMSPVQKAVAAAATAD